MELPRQQGPEPSGSWQEAQGMQGKGGAAEALEDRSLCPKVD